MSSKNRPVLVAPDSFKGTHTASEVARAIGRGLARVGLSADLCPVADGGEGTLDALLAARGGTVLTARVHDPIGRLVDARFGLLSDGRTAVVEMAEASGLGLVSEHERDAWAASTRGTGELIVAAVAAGATDVLVAVGGSATTDGGAGAIDSIERAGGLDGASIVVLGDVATPWERAPAVFAPQKGADPGTVSMLERRLDAFADTLPRDPRGVPRTGAAGGLSGGLWAAFDAALESGAGFVLDTLAFDARLEQSRCVVTGEGKLDGQTAQGKLIGEIGLRAEKLGRQVHAIVGVDARSSEGAGPANLGTVLVASSLDEIENAGARLGAILDESGA